MTTEKTFSPSPMGKFEKITAHNYFDSGKKKKKDLFVTQA